MPVDVELSLAPAAAAAADFAAFFSASNFMIRSAFLSFSAVASDKLAELKSAGAAVRPPLPSEVNSVLSVVVDAAAAPKLDCAPYFS